MCYRQIDIGHRDAPLGTINNRREQSSIKRMRRRAHEVVAHGFNCIIDRHQGVAKIETHKIKHVSLHRQRETYNDRLCLCFRFENDVQLRVRRLLNQVYRCKAMMMSNFGFGLERKTEVHIIKTDQLKDMLYDGIV